MSEDATPLLRVRNLRVDVAGTGIDIVDEVSFDLHRGEVVGLVGESGCGKTAVAMALLGHARPGTKIAGGRVLLGELDLLALGRRQVRRLRGERIAYVPQDPSRSLNPRRRVLVQIDEVLRVHGRDPDAERQRVGELLAAVMLPASGPFLRRYPHELSGGQQQRIVLVMALACGSDVVILDEPTTGLDVTTQAHVLKAIRNLRALSGSAFVHVTHDLAVVGNLADRIMVMYAGRIVELGATERLLAAAAHPYTALLLASTPSIYDPTPPHGLPGTAPSPDARPQGCAFVARCPLAKPEHALAFPPEEAVGPGHTVRCFRWREARAVAAAQWGPRERPRIGAPLLQVRDIAATYGRDERLVRALDGVTFEVGAGECVAVVGESGSGKSTLARCIAGLHPSHDGVVALGGRPLAPDVRVRPSGDRRAIQLVYQNPDRSLNPRRTVRDQIARPLELFGLAAGADAAREVAALLDRVRLPAAAASRFPGELSGGEKQRVAVARALAARPSLLLCDEVTSSLDVSVQAAVLELLEELRAERSLAMLYISHDLAVVSTVADRILVLHAGEVREEGTARRVIDTPEDAYTRELIAASPELPAVGR